MQKKLIALAIAGLASSAAFADSNVTIYGRMDFGYANRGGNSGASGDFNNRSEFTSGGQSASRLGFKGAEDLGNGLKVIFETEFGLGIDQRSGNASTGAGNVTTPGGSTGTTAATWTNRHSYVGLTGGFGTAVGGRLDGVRYGIFTTYDPFGAGTVGNFTQITTQYDRADNAIAYISPSWNGFGLVLAYATNTQGAEGGRAARSGGDVTRSGNEGDDQLQTVMVTYDNGPFSAKLDYETTRNKNVDDSHLHVATVGASWDFHVAKVSAVYDVITGTPHSTIGGGFAANAKEYDRRNWFVGVSAPFGKFTGKASYGQVHNRDLDDAGAKKWAIGVDYSLSKRTNLYADYSRINNDDNASFTLTQAANSGAGYGIRGFDLGIAHNF